MGQIKNIKLHIVTDIKKNTKCEDMDPPQEYYGYNDGTESYDQGNTGVRSQPPQPMDTYGGHDQQYGQTQLFEDTSNYNDPNMFQEQDLSSQQMMYPGQEFLQSNPGANMAANMAMQYGQQFVPAAGEYVEKKIESFLSLPKLKYYFAVDTAYVVKKLSLLAFPFAHEDWSLKYDKSEPAAPRYEINSPDLYIPSMAFLTYVLICGLIFGTQNRFTPEQLGMTASTAMAWLVLELVVIIATLYTTGISGNVRYLDLLALCGYKYVGMIAVALCGLTFRLTGYYVALGWMSLSIAFFMARTLRLVINPHPANDGVARSSGEKRRLYILLYISLTQPLFMYFLTRQLNQSV